MKRRRQGFYWTYVLAAAMALALAAFLACLSGCGPAPQGTVGLDGGADGFYAPYLPGEADDPGPRRGNLPIGYYEQQCHWDACGGPLPDRRDPLKNPTREEQTR